MVTKLQIPMCPDAKGYLDRECHNPNCSYTFKVMMDDWKNKVSDDTVHCPMCGHIAAGDQWATREQIAEAKKRAQAWAQNYIQNIVGDALKKLAASTRGSKYIKITYKPGRRISFQNNPIGQREEWENEITCEKCGTRYSVIGSAYFCPCCGFNSANQMFLNSMDCIGKMLDAVTEIRAQLEKTRNRDDADNICRKLLENSIGEIVSGFQKFAACRYEMLSGRDDVRVNDFQIIDKGSNLFAALCGSGYETWLSSDEIQHLKLFFQRRHILEHNGGIVDQRYIEQSGDTSLNAGQRIVVREADARNLLAIVQKLGEGLKQLEKHW